MKQISFCLVAFLTIIGCKQKEESKEKIHFSLNSHFRDVYDMFIEPDEEILAFFFDIDGDGMDEAFITCRKETNRFGSYWRTFYYQNGICLEADNVTPFSYVFGYAEDDFYYRDDVKQQPRLFRKNYAGKGYPVSFSLNEEKKLVLEPFDKDEFSRLQEKGILKPIESHWYDKDNKIIRTVKGGGEPDESDDEEN